MFLLNSGLLCPDCRESDLVFALNIFSFAGCCIHCLRLWLNLVFIKLWFIMPRLQRSWSIVCVEHFSFCWMLFISYFIFPRSLQFSDCMMVVLVLCPTLLYYFDLWIAWSMLCLLVFLYAHDFFNLVDCMIDWSLLFIYATIFREIDLVDFLIAWSLLCQNTIYLCHEFP